MRTKIFLGLGVAAGVLTGCGDDDIQPPPSDGAPFVTAASPAEGASGVDPATDVVSITFSELMNTTAGTLSLEGGGSLGTPVWDSQTLTVSISGLAPETAHRLVLSGFVDAAGTALDGAPYLGDGALDFTTGPEGADTTPPTVVDADPNEGQVDVAVDLAAITLTFDEPMDTAVTDASLTGGGQPLALTGSWDEDGTTISFALTESLEFGTAYRLELNGYADVAGNLLDGSVYLVDGALDFVSIGSSDTTAPVVVASEPAEAAFNLDPDMQVITITFSEDMDASTTAIPLAEGTASPELVTGVWSDGDTLLTINLPGFLTPGAVYHLDLTGLTDEAGNALDATDGYLANGILDFAMGNPTGDSCNDPLVLAQATENAGAYTWTIASGAVGGIDGQFSCDSTGAGTDAVVRYVKTSDTLANGGNLLHVSAVGISDDINLEITSGNCSAAVGTVESCLWFKSSWDKFLDVPPGTYWIWVSDDDTGGGFPGATITVEEIPATAPQAEGEGCFAPYTTASAIYTAPATSNDFHVWTIPGTINSFDIAESSASVGSISCDDHPTYGDIHGVDAVVEFQKTSPSSVLLVEVDNLDPSLSQSNLDVEVLTGCDTSDAGTTSLYCSAAADNFAFTAIAGAGPVYVWVATEATGEEFNGAEVRIREFTPGIGETRATAEPLTASGPIAPSSSVGLDRPSCFPPTGNVHWYSYTTTGTLFGVQGDAAAPIAVVNAAGDELTCSTDTTSVAIGKNVPAGTTLYFAVESPTAIGNLAIIDQIYTGLAGNATNLNITFPVSALTEYSMAVGANEVFMGSTSEIWSFPKTGNATAVEHNTGEGLGTAQLGYDIAYAGGRLFSVENTATTTVSRLFSVHEEATSTWGPTAWDTPLAYPASAPVYSMATDGTSIIMASRETTASEPLLFMSVPVAAPSSAVTLGSYTGVYYVTGIAADASYFYVVGRETTADEFLYRFDRANLSAPPLRLARINANTTRTNVAVDDLTAASHVYVRDDDNVLHVVANPGAAPVYLGGLLAIGGAADYAMAIDTATDTMYMFDSGLASNGGIVEIQ